MNSSKYKKKKWEKCSCFIIFLNDIQTDDVIKLSFHAKDPLI